MNRRDWIKTTTGLLGVGVAFNTGLFSTEPLLAEEIAKPTISVTNSVGEQFKEFAEKHFKNLPNIEPFQVRLIDCVANNNYVIATKFRQGGFSTTMVAYLLWKAVREAGHKIIVINKTTAEAHNSFTILTNILKSCDFPICTGLGAGYHEILIPHAEISIDNPYPKSTIRFQSDVFPGQSATEVFFDEPAFWDNAQHQYSHAQAALRNAGDPRFIAISTPNKVRGWFYETYLAALRSKNDFKVFWADYKECPFWTNDMVMETRSRMSEVTFRREMLQEFVSPAHSYLTKDQLGMYRW